MRRSRGGRTGHTIKRLPGHHQTSARHCAVLMKLLPVKAKILTSIAEQRSTRNVAIRNTKRTMKCEHKTDAFCVNAFWMRFV